jgi:predicted metal-dependent phosphoesterase TrpH
LGRDAGRLRADMHMHSTVSDGKPSPAEIVVEALSKGLDVISVTDHDSFEGSLRAARIAREEKLDLVVVIGAEIRTTAGDVLVYCADKPLARIPRDPGQLADYAHENNCLVVPAHPFDLRRKGIGDLVYSLSSKWDAIEVFNAASDPLSNSRAREAAEALGLPGLANSDAHVLEAIGSAYTIIEYDAESAEDVLEAIRKGRVIPVGGRPGITALAKQFVWSIERRVFKRRRERGRGMPSRLDYIDESGAVEF